MRYIQQKEVLHLGTGTTFACKTTFEPVDNIALTSMTFSFEGKTYTIADNYVNFLGFSYKSGKKRQYINSRKLTGILYEFSLSGNASNKAYSISKQLAEALSELIGGTCHEEKELYFGVTSGNVSYIIFYDKEQKKVLVSIDL